MKNKKFPFSDAPNTACFTCCHVLEENKPILYVSHGDCLIGSWVVNCLLPLTTVNYYFYSIT